MSILIEKLTAFGKLHRTSGTTESLALGIAFMALGCASLLWPVGFGYFNAALLLTVALAGYYYRIDAQYALVLLVPMLLILLLGSLIASLPALSWMIFTGVIIAVGVMYLRACYQQEEQRSAFIEDVRLIPIGPLFVVALAGFRFGWRLDVKQQIHDEEAPEPVAHKAVDRF